MSDPSRIKFVYFSNEIALSAAAFSLPNIYDALKNDDAISEELTLQGDENSLPDLANQSEAIQGTYASYQRFLKATRNFKSKQ